MSNPDFPDLDSMQFDELWTIHEELTKILSDRILGEKRELEKRLAKLNQPAPSTTEARGEGSRDRPSRRKYPKVLPKYFNPLSPTETWSGRGKQPRWLTTALQTGHAIEDFRIKRMPNDDGDGAPATEEQSSSR
jgi:DNA-binding protein H-NS